MDTFNIFRCEKLKSVRAVLGAIAHNTRKVSPPNANASKASLNIFPKAMSSYAKCRQRFQKKIDQIKAKGSIRKNAVYAHEFIVTCSPELMSTMRRQQQAQYFTDAAHFIVRLHGGDMSNLISMSVHNDESNSHAHYIILPVIDERLNSRSILGGHKSRLSTLQTQFNKEVGRKNGMQRGKKGAKTSHKQLSEYYKQVEHKKALESEIERLEQQAKTLRELIVEYQIKIKNIKLKYVEEFKEVILKPAVLAVGFLMDNHGRAMKEKLDSVIRNAPKFEVEKSLPKGSIDPIVEPVRRLYKR